MAVDITTIGIEYDTSGLEKGTRAQDKTRDSANKLGDSVDKTEKSFSSLNKILGIAAGAMAAVGGVMLAKQFTETADAVSLMDARLKMATGSLEDFKQAQKDIYAISQANNVGIKETTSLYTKLSDPVRRLGGTSKEVAAIVDSFATSLRVGGASAQEASAATLQFAQAMASGKLQGDEFRSISEASPRFMKALAEGMGKPIEKLKEMSSEGKLTADVVGNALVKSLAQLKKEAAGLPDTVSGAITRFKNDVILAVGEISNSQGFTVGFAGLIEQARGLIPVIKDEVMGAFVAVNGWIERNKEEIGKVWEVAKGIVGDVWEVAKGAFSVAGFIVEWAIQSGLVKTTFETIRFLIAGFQDGVTAIGAGFAYVGSQIFQAVLAPLQFVLETSAKIAGVFDDKMAANIRAVGKDIDDFAKGGENYAKTVVDAFGKGDSAVGRLNAELEKTNSETKKLGTESKKATDLASGGYLSLKSKIKETDDEAKKLSIHEMAAQAGRKAGHKAEREFLKELEKDFKQFSSDQISRTKDVTKEIISGIQEQSKNYLAYNKSLDDHAQRMSDMNALAQLEIDTLGMSAVQRNTLIEQKKIELNLEKQIREIRASNMAEGEKNLLIDKANSQALIDKSTAQLRVQQNEWSKFYGEIYNGLSDSLYRGFEAGKGFFQSFWDSIKNLFKTTVLKLAVQAVVTSVLGSGISGIANAQGLGAQGSGISSLSSIYSMGKSLWDGFSAAGTIGGGVTTLGNALGSSTLSAFGSGMSLSSSQAASAAAAYNGAGMTGTGTAISAGSSAAAAVPIVGWILAGMAANNSLFGQGWGGKASNSTKQLGIASGMVGTAFESTIQKMFGLSDKTASMLTGSAVVNRLFGYKTPELQQSELSANFGGDSVSAQIRDVYKQQGGVFRGDKWSENKNSVAGDQLKNLNGMFDSIKLAAAGYADVLGLSSDTIKNFTKEVKVNLSITGDAAKDAEANGKIWADLIGGVADDLSKYLMPNLADFAKEGEKSGDTFARIAANLGGVNAAFSDLNLTLFKTSDVGIKAASNFVDLFGGLDKFQAASQSYYQNFYTQEERNANVIKSLTAELEKQNLILPSSRDGYRALVEEVSKTGSPEQLASLFKLSDAFASVFDGVDSLSAGLPIFVNSAMSYASTLETQFTAQRKVEVAALEATQALEAQARATMELAKAEKQKTYDEALQSRLRSGKIGEIMAANYDLNPVDFGGFMSGGQFDATGFNGEILRKQAKLSLELIAKASADAINVEDISTVFSGLFEFTKGDEFKNYLFRSLPANSNNLALVMADFLDASIEGMRLKNWKPSGEGILNVINAQDEIAYQDNLLTQYNRSLTSAGEALRLGIVTQDQYNDAIAKSAEIIKEQVRSQEELSSNLQKAGIESIAFYFGQIGKSVEELNKVAAETAAPLSQVTSAIGRLTSIADVFGMSANAAGGKESGITSVANAQLVASAAAIAAGVITSADAAAAAKLLADKTSFAGVDKTNLRDISLIFEGLKEFDAISFENSFMRMNDALNKGAITQEQYQDIFDQSLNTYQGLDASTKAVADAMENLRKSMGGFADQLLIDKQKTTLTQGLTLNELLRQYEVAKVAAMTGEPSSVNKFQDLANQVLDVNKYGSRAEYNAAFGAVYRDARNLESVGARAAQGENVVAELKNLNKSQTERIDRLEDALLAALVQIAKNTKDTVNTLELAEIP